jgi:hypothetical protein
MSAVGDCQWCPCADDCGAEAGRPVADCPVRSGAEPTNRDILRLLVAMQTGINQRFAQVMLLLNRHQHLPGVSR